MKKILILAFTASVMLGACKKSDDTSKEELCTKVSSYTSAYEGGQYNETVTFNLTHDSQGRVTKVADSDGSSTYTYTYSTTSIKEEHSGVGDNAVTYTLNNKSQIIKEENGVSADFTFTYTYDTDGYLKDMTRGVEKTTYTWLNGNLVEEEYTIGGVSQGKISYTYYDEVAPQSYLLASGYTGNESDLYAFFGKPSKNLLKSISGSDYSSTFQYTKDDKGRISKVVESQQGGDKNTSTINYSCD